MSTVRAQQPQQQLQQSSAAQDDKIIFQDLPRKRTCDISLLGNFFKHLRAGPTRSKGIFSKDGKAALLDDVKNTIACLQQLPTDLEAIEITSTPSLELGDTLDRFTNLSSLIVRTPTLSLAKIPETLQFLSLSTYDLDIESATNEKGDLDLSQTRLKDLFIDPESDFGTEGDIVLPDTLERFLLNRTCSSYVRRVPETLKGAMLCADYPFVEVFKSENVMLYD